jgi:hypothetical protein
MAGVFLKSQQQAKYVASDILTYAGSASVGLPQSLVGSQAAHNGGWVGSPLNEPIKE